MRQTKETPASLEPKRKTALAARVWVRMTFAGRWRKKVRGGRRRLRFFDAAAAATAAGVVERRDRREPADFAAPVPGAAASSGSTSDSGGSQAGAAARRRGARTSSIAPTASTSPAPIRTGPNAPTSGGAWPPAPPRTPPVRPRVRPRSISAATAAACGAAAEVPQKRQKSPRRRTEKNVVWPQSVAATSGLRQHFRARRAARRRRALRPARSRGGPARARSIPRARSCRRRRRRRRDRAAAAAVAEDRRADDVFAARAAGTRWRSTPPPFSSRANLTRGVAPPAEAD